MVRRISYYLVHVAGLGLAFFLDGWNGVITVSIVYPLTAWASGKVDWRKRPPARVT